MDKIGKFFRDLEDYGIVLGLLIAGFWGGLLSLKNKQELSRWEKVLSIVSGMATANYGTPMVYEYFEINNGISYGIGFLLGYLGHEGIQLGLVVLRNKILGKEKKD